MSDDESNFSLFKIKFYAITKSFSTQKSDTPVNADDPWIFEISTVVELKHSLWPKVRGLLRREIFFIEKQPTWGEHEIPQEEDQDKFVCVFDKISRRFYLLSEITTKDLHRWSDGRILNLIICQYSNAIHTKANWQTAEKKLLEPGEKDRAGAAAESAIGQVVDQLKAEHRLHYQSSYICWRQWADYIFKQPAHLREWLLSDPPPSHLIHLFARTRSDTDALVAEVRQNLNVGEGINEGMCLEVAGLRSSFDCIKKLIDELTKATQSFEVRLSALEQKCKNTSENLTLFQKAVRPQENEYGVELYNKIGEQDDVDHC